MSDFQNILSAIANKNISKKVSIILDIEGYKERGCTNAYVNSTSNLLSEDEFNMDIKINASWQRALRATIFLNNTNGQDSKMVITSLKLAKAE